MDKNYKFQLIVLLWIAFFIGCHKAENKPESTKTITLPTLTEKQAVSLGALPLECTETEYPNKPSEVLNTAADIASPKDMHPAFYGCFDWHSAVHGHWLMASIVNKFPNLKEKETFITALEKSITEENIRAELSYFEKEYNYSYERTYGWAWLLKLSEALYLSKEKRLQRLHETLMPLTIMIEKRYLDYLPKLQYATRVGTHTNTAFGLSLAWDYAQSENKTVLKQMISQTAMRFYEKDTQCPMAWEPGGSDFLSPCLEEANLMRKVLNKKDFNVWFKTFLPELLASDYQLKPGIVSDRKDGHLVHLDGLNFSRAWCLMGIYSALETPPENLKKLAVEHYEFSIDEVLGDSYEGSHWLGTFAVYALVSFGE